jgi:hypothetical protein
MRSIRVITAGLLLAIAALALPGAALAEKSKPKQQGAHVGRTTFVVKGLVAAAPGANATSVQMLVNTGNRPVANLLGTTYTPTNVTFPLSTTTTVYQWANDNKAKLATTSTLAVGDPIMLSIVAKRDTTWAQLVTMAASRVDDVQASTKPAGRFYFFTGKLVTVDNATGKITLSIEPSLSNWRARRAVGQSTVQTFTYNAATAFIAFKNGKRMLFNEQLGMLKGGDRVTLRIFSQSFDARITSLTQIPVWRVHLKEPLASVRAAAHSK